MTLTASALTGCLALATLAGCAAAPHRTPDEIRLVWHRTDTAWADYVRIHGGRMSPGDRGFYRYVDGVCHVYAPDPALGPGRTYRLDQWATLGHEVKHCFDGHFHGPAQ